MDAKSNGDNSSQSRRGQARTGLATWWATGLGAGFSPFAPGTVGTLWGIPLAIALDRWLSPGGQLAAVAALFAIGVPICTAAARELGSKKDPGAIVWDEIATFPLATWGLALSPGLLVAAFLLHRVFDITKPPPARQLEALPRGLGIMADDAAAAIYANLALRAGLWLLSALGAT